MPGRRSIIPRLAQRQEGAMLLVIVLISVGLIFLAPLMADFGSVFIARRQGQTAADAGALAGAEEIVRRLDTRLRGRFLRDFGVGLTHMCWPYIGEHGECLGCGEILETDTQMALRYLMELWRAMSPAQQKAIEFLNKNDFARNMTFRDAQVMVDGAFKSVGGVPIPNVFVSTRDQLRPPFALSGLYAGGVPDVPAAARAVAELIEVDPHTPPRCSCADYCQVHQPSPQDALEAKWAIRLVREGGLP